MWATMLLQSRSRELWVRQIIMCTVPSSDRRRRFLQYNVMDPGLGVTISYGGPGPPAPPPPLAPALIVQYPKPSSRNVRIRAFVRYFTQSCWT